MPAAGRAPETGLINGAPIEATCGHTKARIIGQSLVSVP
jgi:hypothetical protein